ncbi:hypothetical protein [Pseudoteredinibacter isoporae]|uniref:Secreted protein n=1 Tax=Pseudoteredinibacter isoporae TaxID=570281 RepID=A0A7X0JSY5_9GAMM|nr:hypothetical protein [Pseudoteredinibacter isoporae]MBB6521679.1 hypothetical protein [Pseudoteredinibacter isoporae]NHO87227.1 hypothetical protein [Pseudoteredinibacter isoporae]NIB23141.1 hypothetical protein [Pseudoteredinibacter isoporae]
MARKAFYSLATLFLLLSSFIYIGSQDAETIDDHGLSALAVKVPDSENGFRYIAFTQDEGYETFSSSCEKEKLQRHLDQEHWSMTWSEGLFLENEEQIKQTYVKHIWDEQWVQDLLESQKETIELAITATKAKRFDLSVNAKTFMDIDYVELVDIGKLLILKSMQHARNNETEEAIKASNAAIKFGQLVKTEASHILISFMVGERIQQTALSWQAKLFQELEIPKHSYMSALTLLDEISKNANHHYGQVITGEYLYSKQIIQDAHKENLLERWRIFFAPEEDEFDDSTLITNSFGNEDLPLIEDTMNFLFATFPDFYYHKNTETTAYAKYLLSVKESVLKGCQNIPEISIEPSSPEYSITDLFTPNAIGTANNSNYHGAFNGYQLRHCLNRLQIEANKLILAANWARDNHCEKVANLNDLQKYLGDTQAIDPFSEEALKLSKDGNEVYSVGKSGTATEDDEGIWFHSECHYEEACYNKPSFPLYQPTLDELSDLTQ